MTSAVKLSKRFEKVIIEVLLLYMVIPGRINFTQLGKYGRHGEHGGEPSSVKFCHKVGLNYVSCSPFRVPIARLAAAQAAVEE